MPYTSPRLAALEERRDVARKDFARAVLADHGDKEQYDQIVQDAEDALLKAVAAYDQGVSDEVTGAI